MLNNFSSFLSLFLISVGNMSWAGNLQGQETWRGIEGSERKMVGE